MKLNINTLSQRLSIQLDKISENYLTKKINLLKTRFSQVSEQWLNEVRADLSGKRSGKPNYTLNPYERTGNLLRSLYYRITVTRKTRTATISITRSFDRRKTRGRGLRVSYGDILNESDLSIAGFKERAYAKLDKRIKELL